VTVIYAVIDLARETATFARAGHELPLFVRRDPVTGLYRGEFFGSEGMAVGMVPDEIFTPVIADRTVAFVPGDVLVLYTDGITEAPNEEEKEFSGARLADTVLAVHGRTAQEIGDGILQAVQRFAGDTPQRDDLTLVTVKRT
jgi:sigma-B regulation protein RsbU (phosphoserine phosphatase)